MTRAILTTKVRLAMIKIAKTKSLISCGTSGSFIFFALMALAAQMTTKYGVKTNLSKRFVKQIRING
jgi:hypothetical protein